MKKLIVFAIVTAVVFIGCVSTGETNNNMASNFSEVIGIEWVLTKVLENGADIGFGRDSLVFNDLEVDFFTLQFDSDIISGVGAPNRYSAPYSLTGGKGIEIMLIRSTLMFSLFEPELLKEHEYFSYLQNAYEWNYSYFNLELRSKTENNRDVVMIFSR